MFRLSPRLRIIDACSKADVCGEADANLSLLAGHRGKLFFIYQFKKIFNLLFLSGSIMGSMDLAEDADCFVLSLSVEQNMGSLRVSRIEKSNSKSNLI